MAQIRQLKNNTLATIVLSDVGYVNIAAAATYTIPPQDYLLYAASTDTLALIDSGDLIVNDGIGELNAEDGHDFIEQLFLNPWRRKETTVGASATVDIDSLELSYFKSLKYVVNFTNDTTGNAFSMELLANKMSDDTLIDSVYGKIGDIGLYTAQVMEVGSDAVLRVTNNSLNSVTVLFYRLNIR